MRHNLDSERKSVTGHRREQVRHLVRSVGVQLQSGARVPFFIEPTPGRFRRNPSLRDIEVTDDQLRTLTVPAEIRAKIPAGGLPAKALRHLIEIGLNRGDDL